MSSHLKRICFVLRTVKAWTDLKRITRAQKSRLRLQWNSYSKCLEAKLGAFKSLRESHETNTPLYKSEAKVIRGLCVASCKKNMKTIWKLKIVWYLYSWWLVIYPTQLISKVRNFLRNNLRKIQGTLFGDSDNIYSPNDHFKPYLNLNLILISSIMLSI